MVQFYRNLERIQYDRTKAVQYAHRWAYGRNPDYFNFENYGGDCTNFASQVILAGSSLMNYTPVYGWYYINSYNRTAAWTGVDYLYNFLINNQGIGPYAEETDIKNIEPGDIIQLSFHDGPGFNHTPIVVQTGSPVTLDNILVAAHTDNQDYYSIRGYDWVQIRFIHILGVRG